MRFQLLVLIGCLAFNMARADDNGLYARDSIPTIRHEQRCDWETVSRCAQVTKCEPVIKKERVCEWNFWGKYIGLALAEKVCHNEDRVSQVCVSQPSCHNERVRQCQQVPVQSSEVGGLTVERLRSECESGQSSSCEELGNFAYTNADTDLKAALRYAYIACVKLSDDRPKEICAAAGSLAIQANNFYLAETLLDKGCTGNSTLSCENYGVILARRADATATQSEKIKLNRKAARVHRKTCNDMGDQRSCMRLASLLFEAPPGLPRNNDDISKVLESRCDTLDPAGLIEGQSSQTLESWRAVCIEFGFPPNF